MAIINQLDKLFLNSCIKAHQVGVAASEQLTKFRKNEKGVTAVEYAIVLAGIAGIVSVIFASDSGTVKNMLTGIFSKVEAKVTSASNL